MLKQKNSKKQGDVGVGVAIGWFVAQGHTVSIPLTDSQDYDLVVEIDGFLKKVQVKTSRSVAPSGGFTVGLRTNGGNRTGTGKSKLFHECSADILFALTEDGDMFVIPAQDCPRRSLTTGPKWEKFRVN